MIRYFASHDITDCTNQQSTTWVTHGENQKACASGDNAKKTHNDLSWFIWVTIYESRCNSETFRMIQRDRAFSEEREPEQLQERRVLQLWYFRALYMRMSETEEITEYHCYQMRPWRYKVMSVDNHNEIKFRVSSSRTRKHGHQSSA